MVVFYAIYIIFLGIKARGDDDGLSRLLFEMSGCYKQWQKSG